MRNGAIKTNGATYTNGVNGHKPPLALVPDLVTPFSEDVEQAILGSCIMDYGALIQAIDTGLKPDHFFVTRHQWIYDACLHLGQSLDLITLTDELTRRGQIEQLGDPAYLTSLIAGALSPLNAAGYARIVKRLAVKRQLIDAAGEISRQAYRDEAEADEAVSEAMNLILDIADDSASDKPHPVKAVLSDLLDEYERRDDGSLPGLPTGLKDLDQVLDGLAPGKLIYLAGRPGHGKSSLALQMATYNAQHHAASVLLFSLEMPRRDLVERILSAQSGIDSRSIRRKRMAAEEWSRFLACAGQVENLPLYIDDKARTIEEIAARTMNHYYRHGLDLLVVDYVQRVSTARDYRTQDLAMKAISGQLKDLAGKLNIPVVAVSSLNRALESRHDKRPMLSDLRDSGSLEYDADQVIGLYMDGLYHPDGEMTDVAELIVLKNRGSVTETVQAFFRKHTTTFLPLAVSRQSMEYWK